MRQYLVSLSKTWTSVDANAFKNIWIEGEVCLWQ